MLARILSLRFGAVMAVFAASVGVRVAEAYAGRAVQAKCDRKERHGANRRVSDFPECTQYAHCERVYHNPLSTVKQSGSRVAIALGTEMW